MSELKPCPFCGGEAELMNINGLHYVQCSECEKTIPQLFYGVNNAILEWNAGRGVWEDDNGAG